MGSRPATCGAASLRGPFTGWLGLIRLLKDRCGPRTAAAVPALLTVNPSPAGLGHHPGARGDVPRGWWIGLAQVTASRGS